MFEEDLPESDSSDEDFVPTGERSDVSEEESDDDIGEQAKDDDGNNKRKKTKLNKASRKKKKKSEEVIPDEIEEKEEQPKEENPEDKKKRADALWADFLSDCGPVVKKKSDASVSQPKSEQISTASTDDRLKPETSSKHKISESSLKVNDIFKDFETGNQGGSDKVTEVYEFAGEKVIVEKKVDLTKRPVSRGGGVASILNQINKKTKLSTLEKSKLDWNTFKESEGIDEEIAAHNRGKNGYLEKRDFLERADLRQFEIEKKMREHTRSKRL